MDVLGWLRSWPVYRQLTGPDKLGRGAATQSAPLEGPAAAHRHRRPGRQVGLPLLRGRLRAAGLRPRRAGRTDRGRPRLARSPAAGSAPRARRPRSWSPARSASRRCATAPPARPSGPTSTCTPPWRWSPTGCSPPERSVGRTPTPRAGCYGARTGFAGAGRRDAGQRGELPDQEVVHRAGRDPDREPGPYLTLRHGSRSGILTRARRRHRRPEGARRLGQHRDHGLEHGRGAPGRVPVGGRGQAARRERDPHRPALHPDQRAGPRLRADPRRQ